MNHIFQLTKYFFRKNLKPIISFSIILLISTIMFVSGLTITINIGKDYDKKFNDLNTSNCTFTISAMQYDNSICEDLKEIESIEDVEVITGIMLNIPVSMSDSTQNQNQIFYNLKEINNISKYNIYKSTNDVLENPIYISYYLYANSSLDLKDKFEFIFDNNTYTFNVKGIVEEMQYGNYSSSVSGQYLDENSYNYLRENNEKYEVKTILIKSEDSNKAYNEVSKYLIKKHVSILNKGYDDAKKQSRLSVSNILSLILLVFSIIILFISLLVTKFKIKQTIEEDITNMGVLKSLGYKSQNIIVGIMIPYLISTFVMSFIGMIVSIPVINLLGGIISSQAGFIWMPKLNILACLITILLNISLTCFFSYISARRINGLNPIEAIRGISTSNIDKKYFEIEKTKGNINIILALKNFMNNMSSNVLLGLVLIFITILSSFVVSLFYNVNVNPTNFINTLVEEYPTVMIKEKQDIKDDIKNIDGVKNVIYYDENGEVTLNDISYKTFIAESYDKLTNDLVYEGRNPLNESEISIGSNIKEKNNYKLGDIIVLEKNGVSLEFEIVGFIQSVNNSGEILEITLDGYKKLDENYTPNCLYVYLENESEAEAKDFIELVDQKFGDKIELTVNYIESMNSASIMFLNIVKLITIVIIVIAVIIIFLILNILISGIITNKKQEFGVLKSIGYKTKDLIFQIVGGLMPISILCILIGIVINKLSMNVIFGFIFKMVGAYKVSFEYPLFIFIITGLFVLISTIAIGVILCRKIKKISVYSLIKE